MIGRRSLFVSPNWLTFAVKEGIVLKHPHSARLKGLFCAGLAAALAVGVAVNSAAAGSGHVSYDVKLDSSSTHTVALSGGDLYAWGTNTRGQIPGAEQGLVEEPVLLSSGVADTAVSSYRTLVVKENGELWQYGKDPAEEDPLPQGQLLSRHAVQVDASDTFAAYVSDTGALYTWGVNRSGQLGNGSLESSANPVLVLESGVRKVSLGSAFGYALMEDGTVYGWGDTHKYQLGVFEDDPVTTPVKVLDGVQDIATGYAHGCLLKQNGDLYTTGSNAYSQTGTGSGDLYDPITRVMGGVASVSAGTDHNFAVAADGTVYSWGYGISGQLGTGATERQDVPTVTNFDFVQVFACCDNTFGVDPEGYIYSFGDNTNYLLGTNGSDSLQPEMILDAEMTYVYDWGDAIFDRRDDQSGSSKPAGTLPAAEEIEIGDLPVEFRSFINGYSDGTFKPEKAVTRAEFLKMLVVALCEDFDENAPYPENVTFSDVTDTDWFAPYVKYAAAKGIVRGYEDGTFKPQGSITRAQAAVMVARAQNLDVGSAVSSQFTDMDSSWASAEVDALAATGVITGYSDGSFRPNKSIPRKEAVTMVAKAAGFQPSGEEIQELTAQVRSSPYSDVSAEDWYYAYVLHGSGKDAE